MFIAFLVFFLLGAVLLIPRLAPQFAVGDWRVLWVALTGWGAVAEADDADGVAARLVAADGYRVAIYAAELPNARLLRMLPGGGLLVSQPRQGRVTWLAPDRDGDGRPDSRRVVVSGLDRPHGIDLLDGWLYIAESGAVGRLRFDPETGAALEPYARLSGIELPAGANHWTRTLRAGKDGWLYVTIGSTCNACEETHPWRASMIRLRPDGRDAEVYARGLRNAVGFDWAPWDGALHATDNGRDLLGDDFPPCELNRVEAGGFYGWPYVNGFGVPDPDLGGKRPKELAPRDPVHGFRAHNAPLGMTFLRSPEATRGAPRSALVALHGSWNRSRPDGYKVVRLVWDDAGKITEQDFLSGFLQRGEVIGRPVDIAEAIGGVLYVSDDYTGVIYRLTPSGRAVAAGNRSPVSGDRREEARTSLAKHSADELSQARTTAAALIVQHRCLECHGSGTPLAQRWQEVARRYDVASLADFFVAPTPPMPAFPLGLAEREALAIYLLDNSLKVLGGAQ